MTTGHLVALAEGWSVWEWFVVRSAGFPIADVLRLADPALAAVVDRVLELETRELDARERAAAEIKAHSQTADKSARRQLKKIVKRLYAGKRAVTVDGLEAVAELEEAVELGAELDDRMAEAEVAYQRATRRVSSVLRDLVSDPSFREALLWQNRRALHTGVAPLLRAAEGASSSQIRRLERGIASYLQRYCAKNDTIGFFGPVGWGRFDRSLGHVAIDHGPSLIRDREVYFEYWAIFALAEALAGDSALLPDIAPRRSPTVYVEGTTLHHPIDRDSELPALFARLLEACDGERTARELAAELSSDPELEIGDPDEVYAALEQLVERGLATWTIEVPTGDNRPERHLRTVLERIDGAPGERARAALDELERHRLAVSEAGGDPPALEPALSALDSCFERLTGRPATRASGKVHAGRTLIYEDCARDLELSFGEGILDEVGPSLALLLQSARYYTSRLGSLFRRELEAAHDRLAAETGDNEVDYLRYWQTVTPLFPPPEVPSPLVEQVRREIQDRWSQILAIDPAVSRLERSAAELAPKVAEAFDAPGPGWPSARHHTADLMVAAASPEAFARGDYQVVLGELGVGISLTAQPLFVDRHPRPADITEALERDVDAVGIAPVFSNEHYTRGSPVSLSRGDLDLEVGETRAPRPRSNVLGVGELVVARSGGQLVVRDRRSRVFDVLAFFERYILAAYEQAGATRLIPAMPHLPRISISGLVVSREQWNFEPEALAPIANAGDGVERFTRARRWARAHGIPRWIFVSLPEERKPFFADLASPIAVDILGRLFAKASVVSISEMLPTPEQLWLRDRLDRAYTCEFRITAVDPVGWAPLDDDG